MLALPAESRLCRERLLHERCRIDENFHLGTAARCKPGRKQFQLSLDDVVIVAAQGIERDHSGVARRSRAMGSRSCAVIHGEHDGAAGLRPQRLRVGAALHRGGKPVHVALASIRNECTQ